MQKYSIKSETPETVKIGGAFVLQPYFRRCKSLCNRTLWGWNNTLL